jgi:S1-C subfamily serine protease
MRWCSSTTGASIGHLSNISSGELSDAILKDEGLLQRLVEELKARGGAADSIRESSGSNSPASPSPLQATRDGGLPQSVLRATVKIFASSSLANCIMPWQKRQQISVSGSGFVIDVSRRMILTNAHVVQGAQFVEVRKHGDSNNHTGYVVYMGTDCDMALVHVPDDVFWSEKALTALSFDVPQPPASGETVSGTSSSKASSPLEELAAMHVRDEAFGGLPQLQDGVKVVGYPVGGDQLSITSGVVSRIEVSSYGRDAPFALLTVQIDAAINHGNSGGPALSTRTKKVIGIAFQVLGNAESIGYIIPLPIVAAFLNGYLTACRQDSLTTASGSSLNDSDASSSIPSVAGSATESQQSSAISRRDYFPHPPTFGVFYQLLLNKHLREYYGLKPGQTGVLVSGTAFRGPAEEVLKPNDVIVGLNGFPVENDGTIEFRPHERLVFTHMVHVCPPGKEMQLRVLRKRTSTTSAADLAPDLSAAPPAAAAAAAAADSVEELTIAVKPRSLRHLVRPNLQTSEFCEKPKYCVFGGLVFSTLTQPLLAEWGDQWFNSAPRWLVEQLSANITAERDEVVVVVQVMPHPVNQSYESMYARIVTQVGGVDVRNFEHFRSLVKKHRDRFTCGGVTGAATPPQLQQANNIVAAADDSNLILQTRALGDLTKVAVLPIEAAIAADRELEHVYQIPPQRWD